LKGLTSSEHLESVIEQPLNPEARDQRADMLEDFETVCFELFKPEADGDTLTVFDPLEQFDPQAEEHADIARSLNAAFLIVLAGRKHPAKETLSRIDLKQFDDAALGGMWNNSPGAVY
jgi:hypothetical protein